MALPSGPALAVDHATDLCPANADPCFVNAPHTVASGSVLDFGTRALELGGNGRLDVGAGSVSIMAGQLVLGGGARLVGAGGVIGVTVGGAIMVDGNARIDVSADRPGWITLTGADVRINGLVAARATTGLDGGNIDVRAGEATLGGTARLSVIGGDEGFGGLVTLATDRAFTMDGVIDASGGDGGGAIEIGAARVAASGTFDVSGGPGGLGALLEINAAGPVVLGAIQGASPGAALLGGGAGADVLVVAGGSVELNGEISLSGGGVGGQGGLLSVTAGGDLVQRGAIVATASGPEGFGGEVALRAAGNATLAGIDVSAREKAGRITADAAQGLTVADRLVADALVVGAQAGAIALHGCAVDVLDAGVVSSAGSGGRNLLQSSGAMLVRGVLAAGEANVLEYRDSALAPQVLGTPTPLPTLVANAALAPCGVTTTTLPPAGPTTTTLAGQQCSAVFAGYDLVLCRLAAMRDLIERAAMTKPIVRSLSRRLARLEVLVNAARGGRRPAKKLKAAERQLAGLVRVLRRSLQRDKVDATLAERLLDLAGGAANETRALRTGRR
jgi:hypothetical protein